MAVEIRVPALGESIVDGVIASWLKKEGDQVRPGEELVVLETDKVNVEIPAERGGVLQKIVKQEGETVAVGEVLGLLGEDAGQETAAGPDAPGQTETAAQPAAPVQAPATSAGPGRPTPVVEQANDQPAAAPEEDHRATTPLARRIAAEHNVDLAQIRTANPQGRLTKEDVLNYLSEHQTGQPAAPQSQPEGQPQGQPTAPAAAWGGSATGVPVADAVSKAQSGPEQPATPATSARPTAPPAPTLAQPAGREERVRLSRRRQTIAQRLVEAQQTAAMLTTFNEVDMSAVMEVRARRKESFKERHSVSLGFMSFFTKAVVGALKAYPRLNAEIQGQEMVLKRYYDIGIAVGAEEGLVVPVLRDADRKSFAQIEREIADLGQRARSNSLGLAELQGGTFTITNGGVFGSLLSTPILNAPQVGILGMHKIEERPIALKGQVVIRPMMYLALSYDHRIVDGREAVLFLVRVKELIEDPETLLLEG